MATPLHHDQPQQTLRMLQTLKSNSKKHAEDSMDSDCVAWKFAFPQPNIPGVQPTQHQDSPTNQRDLQPRRGAQQLPPRPPLSPTQTHRQQHQQQHLRQRHQAELGSIDPLNEVRAMEKSRMSSPAWSYNVSSLPSSELDRPHLAKAPEGPKPSNSDRPHAVSSVESSFQSRMHQDKVKKQLPLLQQPDCQYFSSNGECTKITEHSSLHSYQQKHLGTELGHHSPHGDLVDTQKIAEFEKHILTQKLASSSITNSRSRDYKAALSQNIPQEKPQLGQCCEQPILQNAKEDYFGCKQDEKRQAQGQSQRSRLEHAMQAQENQQLCLDFSRMQYFVTERCSETSSAVHSGALSSFKGHVPQHAKVANQHPQKQSNSHLVVPAVERYFNGDCVGDQGTVDLETSPDSPHTECDTLISSHNHNSMSPQQLHDDQFVELSDASPDDSYFHVSKELVERDYENECHLASFSTNHQQSCGHVYDYSRAGVTLVENIAKLANEQPLATDRSRDEQGLSSQSSDNQECKDDCSYCEEPDAQSEPGVLDHQLQDVESPPLFLGFNQKSTHFACGTSKGFRVYDVSTMNECFSSMVGGVGIIELLSCTSIVLLVGAGPNPSFPPNKVILWDGLKGEPCGERSQKYPILAVKAQLDQLVVVVENEVSVYNRGNTKLLFQMITISNPKGLCAISINDDPSILAFPGLKRGEVRIEHIRKRRGQEELPARNSLVICAHDSGLACMALTPDGSLLATASDRGTLIRVFSTHDGRPLKEVRRGMDRAEIYSIAFSFSSDWLAVSSDKGTVHVFCLGPAGLKTTDTNHVSSTLVVKNTGSTLSFIKGVLPKYFSSEWSAAQFKLPEEMKSVVAFGQEKHIIFILGTDGSLYKCSFDPEHGGDMKQLAYSNFMKPKDPMTSA